MLIRLAIFFQVFGKVSLLCVTVTACSKYFRNSSPLSYSAPSLLTFLYGQENVRLGLNLFSKDDSILRQITADPIS